MITPLIKQFKCYLYHARYKGHLRDSYVYVMVMSDKVNKKTQGHFEVK